MLGTILWLFYDRPGTRPDYPKRDQVILKCRMENSSFLISQIFNVILIIVCTIYAIKTRKIPENFNESKFIGFTMYTTCIIWLAFLPIYFGTANTNEVNLGKQQLCRSNSIAPTFLCKFDWCTLINNTYEY